MLVDYARRRGRWLYASLFVLLLALDDVFWIRMFGRVNDVRFYWWLCISGFSGAITMTCFVKIVTGVYDRDRR
ncbi:hypothetical protein HBH56_234290 [Parastagonospora nodorum]|uniref:Uncharacterized protein n=1 Tax=Phaeosphaeria nodorum (strain SN15 / ATCC MYA-4574 / FGSC 10173) TaxID=321614 RepID=A0A7U2F1M7_PHANO|nr:hypothetical protein HBH56_234290 [Parastagonospora nodorum]QRC97076.1 hypothetical protein JI435_410040 [Parastagonospora nodorum SN15]KAH3921304.1 hypothetical protein HBH54_242350 [Parastagonospora nodorum]KAH3944535.1 hypothetical protein HBH53_157910 [Parastagonospora nodorum]KAH4063148.1 hypothetical protein HBH50_192940 [Parastagonospora nodorum]